LKSSFYSIVVSTAPTHYFSTLVVGLKCERVLVNFHNTKAASCALDLAFSVEFTTLYLRSLLHSTKR
jgi:hypothetical protein